MIVVATEEVLDSDNVESMKLRSSSFYIIYYLGRVREDRI